MSTEKPDNLEEALALVDIEYDAEDLLRSRDDPLRRHKDVPEITGWKPFGALIRLNYDERCRLASMSDLISRYIRQQGHSHPLCLAVFRPAWKRKILLGQTNSGRSPRTINVPLPMTTVNLTQLANSAELTGRAARSRDGRRGGGGYRSRHILRRIRYDAERCGLWMASAPFSHPCMTANSSTTARNVELKKAVYVFAGGTASTLSEFTSLRNEREFRSAKGGLNFISPIARFSQCPRSQREPSHA